jgi:hypothetical protein
MAFQSLINLIIIIITISNNWNGFYICYNLPLLFSSELSDAVTVTSGCETA